MPPRPRPRLASLAAGWVVPALAVLAGLPNSARAGCGDYLEMRDGKSHLGVLPLPGHPVLPDPATPGCSGPSCKQLPLSAPTSPVPPGGDRSGDEWACGLAGLFVADRCPCRPIADDDVFPPPDRAVDIFHPPRP